MLRRTGICVVLALSMCAVFAASSVNAASGTALDTTITAGPADGSTIGDPTPTFAFTSNSGRASFQCSVDGAPWSACWSPYTTAPLAPGDHKFAVRAVLNRQVDTTPATRTFIVSPPDTKITDGPTGVTTDPTPTFGFASSQPIMKTWPCAPGQACILVMYDATPYDCRVDGGPWVQCGTQPSAPKISASYTTPPLANGPHSFEVRAYNEHGLLDPTPARADFVVDLPPDTTPPKFAGIKSATTCVGGPVGGGIPASYRLTWEAAIDETTAPDKVVYDIYMAKTPGGQDFTTPAYITDPGVTEFHTPELPSDQAFYFVVRARDAAGNRDSNTVELEGVNLCD